MTGNMELCFWGCLVSDVENMGSKQPSPAKNCLICEQTLQGGAYFSLKMSGMQWPDIQSVGAVQIWPGTCLAKQGKKKREFKHTSLPFSQQVLKGVKVQLCHSFLLCALSMHSQQ